jgi:hypothetical protein
LGWRHQTGGPVAATNLHVPVFTAARSAPVHLAIIALMQTSERRFGGRMQN